MLVKVLDQLGLSYYTTLSFSKLRTTSKGVTMTFDYFECNVLLVFSTCMNTRSSPLHIRIVSVTINDYNC